MMASLLARSVRPRRRWTSRPGIMLCTRCLPSYRSRAAATINYSEEEKGYIGPQNENDNICIRQSASFLDLLTSNRDRRRAPAYILNYILI